jgi:hypothetical protein
MMDRDSITRAGARTPGVKRQWPLERWCTSAPRPSTQIGDTTLQAARCTKGGLQTARREELAVDGKAPSDIPAFQPDWGKPTVRNDRGDDGNVSIIRSLVRAIVLPDHPQQGLVATCRDSSNEA